MNLNNIDLKQFLPLFMQDDKTAKGLAYAIEQQLKSIVEETKGVAIYNRISTMTDRELDEMAYQFSVVEYDPTFSIDIKRNLIKNCLQTHKERGTVAAVEKVVNDIFGNGWVEEWFTYDGQPFHFKVHTTNMSATDTMLKEFEKAVKSTQNIRSYLENIIVESVQYSKQYHAAYLHIAEFIHI